MRDIMVPLERDRRQGLRVAGSWRPRGRGTGGADSRKSLSYKVEGWDRQPSFPSELHAHGPHHSLTPFPAQDRAVHMA